MTKLNKIRVGQPINSFPANTWNKIVEHVENNNTSIFSSHYPTVPGGSGGSTLTHGVIYDDLPGYSRSGISVVVNTAKFLPYTATDSGYDVDLNAEIVEVEPLFGAAVTLSNGGTCCGSGSTTDQELVGTDIYINSPINTNNFVNAFESSDDSISISGGGVNSQSSVTVRFINPSTLAVISSTDANVANDGTWTATLDTTVLTTDGHYIIDAFETDVDSFAHKPISVVIYRDDYGTVDQGVQPVKPPAVDLVQSSDTGDANDDNITTDTTPTFLVYKGDNQHDQAGMQPRLFVDGVLAVSGGDDDFEFSDTKELTLTSALTAGTYAITTSFVYDSTGTPITGGHSDPLYIKVVDSFDTGGEITAVVEASSDFTAEDDPISVSLVGDINNTTDDPDPSDPTSIPQPEVPFAASSGYQMTLKYIDSEWVLQQPTKYCREALVGDVGGVQKLLDIGPCPIQITHAENVKLIQ